MFVSWFKLVINDGAQKEPQKRLLYMTQILRPIQYYSDVFTFEIQPLSFENLFGSFRYLFLNYRESALKYISDEFENARFPDWVLFNFSLLIVP